MQKHELRVLFQQKRNDLAEDKKLDFNAGIKKHLLELISENLKTIHIYLPITSKNEIDTWPIIHELWKKNIKTVVPKLNPSKTTLNSWILTKSTQLKENKWGVSEPVGDKTIDESEVDAVIIPLLAFDKSGYRVGYGKGFYDKYLETLKYSAIKIGLSYFPPFDKISDTDSWDIPLDYCVTPDGIIKF